MQRDVVNAGFARVLETVGVNIEPDAVADADRFEKAGVPGRIVFAVCQRRHWRHAVLRACGVRFSVAVVDRALASRILLRRNKIGQCRAGHVKFDKVVAGQQIFKIIFAIRIGRIRGDLDIIAPSRTPVWSGMIQNNIDIFNALFRRAFLYAVAIYIVPDVIAESGARFIGGNSNLIVGFVTFANRRSRIYFDVKIKFLTRVAIGKRQIIKRDDHGVVSGTSI